MAFSYRLEGAPVLGTGTVAAQGAAVGVGAVALVPRKTVLRVYGVQLPHARIAPDFGDYAGAGDAERMLIAVDNADLRDIAALGPEHVVKE